MNTLRMIQESLADDLALDIARLDPAKPLYELGIDSLALIECMFKLEDRFGISVASEEMKVNTLQDIATMVDRLLAEKNTVLTAESER